MSQSLQARATGYGCDTGMVAACAKPLLLLPLCCVFALVAIFCLLLLAKSMQAGLSPVVLLAKILALVSARVCFLQTCYTRSSDRGLSLFSDRPLHSN